MEELMTESTTYMIAFIGVLIGTLSDSLKVIIKAISNRIVNKINKSRMDNDKHELYNALDNHLAKLEYTTFSESKFKDTVIKDGERILWSTLMDRLKEMDVNVDLNEFNIKVEEFLIRIANFGDDLIAGGLPEKTVKVMAKPTFPVRMFIIGAIKRIIKDNIYDSNQEKLWVIQSLFLEYLNTHHDNTIKVLIHANGSLKGEKYKGTEYYN